MKFQIQVDSTFSAKLMIFSGCQMIKLFIFYTWTFQNAISILGSHPISSLRYHLTCEQIDISSSPSGKRGEIRVSATSARVEGLTPATFYSLTLVAENSVGHSKPSEPLNVTTLEEPPTGFPRNIQVSEILIILFTVSFTINDTNVTEQWTPLDNISLRYQWKK